MDNKALAPSLELRTDKLRLKLITAGDLDGFREIAFDPSIWTYFTSQIADEQHLRDFVDQGIADTRVGARYVFTIRDAQTGRVAGSMCYGNLSPRDARLEIGWSWIGAAYRATHVNHHAKFCLLRHAFEELNCRRVEFKTDVLNERARKALKKIGATEEGVLRSHTLMPGGRRRDTIFYSVLDSEWPDVRARVFADIA